MKVIQENGGENELLPLTCLVKIMCNGVDFEGRY